MIREGTIVMGGKVPKRTERGGGGLAGERPATDPKVASGGRPGSENRMSRVLVLAAILMGAPGGAGNSSGGSPRLVLGGEGPASRDGVYFHVEISAASAPDSRRLLSTAITGSRQDVGSACKVYSSPDGGATWRDWETAEQRSYGGDDPQVAFGRGGTGYFSALANGPGDAGSLDFYRSTDGGATWSGPARVGESSVAYDHQKVAVDSSSGAFSGRIYVVALYTLPYRLGVFGSDDDGRTFTGPVDAAVGPDERGINVCRPLVLRDGTLFVPFFDFPLEMPEGRVVTSAIRFTLSGDGGCSFGPAGKIGSRRVDLGDPHWGEGESDPAFAADTRSERYPDRLYAVWTAQTPDGSRIFFTTSGDRGSRWSSPRPVDAGGPPGSRQFQPTIAVNAKGVVSVAWLDTRNSRDASRCDEYITASIDGGQSFLPSRRVSSESSAPGAGALTVLPTAWRSGLDGLRVSLLAPAGRYEAGGDYCEMTADVDGVFHPFWPDTRSGVSQIWTCPVEVTAEPPAAPAFPLVESVLDRDLDLVFDPPVYDAGSLELRLPVHVRNRSRRTIWGPIRVTVLSFGSGMGDQNLENSPEILNSDNDRKGPGAVFDFRRALGDSSGLAAGARSGQTTWVLRLRNPSKTPDLHLRITGMTESEPSASGRIK